MEHSPREAQALQLVFESGQGGGAGGGGGGGGAVMQMGDQPVVLEMVQLLPHRP